MYKQYWERWSYYDAVIFWWQHIYLMAQIQLKRLESLSRKKVSIPINLNLNRPIPRSMRSVNRNR